MNDTINTIITGTTTGVTSTATVSTATINTDMVDINNFSDMYNAFFNNTNSYFLPPDSLIYNLDNKKMEVENNKVKIGFETIMPSVKEIKVIFDKEGNGKGIIVEFMDDTIEKAICDSEDSFNYETGVMICLIKKLLSCRPQANKKKGTYYFNKLMDLAMAADYKTKKERVEQDLKNEIEKQKRIAKDRKARKKAAKKREKEIELQKEAHIRALKEFNNESISKDRSE